MRHAALGLCGALLLCTSVAGAQADSRWALEIRGPVTAERGELRLDARGGRLLLESSDSAWITLADFRITENQISFLLPASRRRFEGVVTFGAMQGNTTDADGRATRWAAEQIQPGIQRWPVRPRVELRQVVVGTGPSQVILPAGWRAILPTAAAMATERDDLARAAGVLPPTIEAMLNAQRVPLGLDSAGRAAARAMLLKISRGAAADLEFRRIFGSGDQLRTDLHQVAFANLASKRISSTLGSADLVRGLTAFSRTPPTAGDTLSLYSAGWRVWTMSHTDTTEWQSVMDALDTRDADARRAVRALVVSYDEAVAWWVDAVQWLLNRAWIETPQGLASPAVLVGAFWEKPGLTAPPIDPTNFGSVQAVPVVGAARLGARLIRPLNASAVEWLAQGGFASALNVWRAVDTDDSLAIVRGGRSMQLTSPAAVARSRLGGFLSGRDAIRMEPGISPVFAVVTAVHEWQHLLFEGARLEGAAPGYVDTPDELRLLDGNPWMAEGAAEWATELILSPARTSAPLLPYMEALKRASIDALTGGDDPHALGYLLVRALATRGGGAGVLRDRLVRWLHDPLALAKEYRLDGAVRGVKPILLNRPNGAGVIPEIIFTWDGGVAEHLSRRLIVPAHLQEP